MPPSVLHLLISLCLCTDPSSCIDNEAIVTWYGGKFVGRRHSASWNGQTPEGFGERVTLKDFGVAAPQRVPFGTRVRITRECRCNGEPSPFDGRVVEAVVVDRLARDWEHRWDLWPAAFQALGELDEGCVRAKIELVEKGE